MQKTDCETPERVYVENEWYDGPRAGVANVHGVPHRFTCVFDEAADDYLPKFLIWPLDPETVAFEIEQWLIFVEWNECYEAGTASTDTHPGHGGIHKRWDELEMRLRASRSEVPANARRAEAQLVPLENQARYAPSGPAYMLAWNVL